MNNYSLLNIGSIIERLQLDSEHGGGKLRNVFKDEYISFFALLKSLKFQELMRWHKNCDI